MKTLAGVIGVSFWAVSCFAQSNNAVHVRNFNTYGSVGGFGNVLYPGVGHGPAPGSQFSITDPTFASRLGATVNGAGFGGRGFRHFSQPILAVPYAYPVYVGGYGYGDPNYGYQQQPNVTIINPPQQVPQVVINQNFIPERATPVMREYSQDSSGGVQSYEAPGREPVQTSPEDNTDYYLLAFKDHSIYSAFAYWVEGDTLHYVTPQRAHNQVSLSLVDRELTDKLNCDRNLQVKLPN
jgi:hypothetical protein